MLKGLLLSGLMTLLWGIAQLIVFHVSFSRSRFRSMVTGFVATLPVYLVLYVLTPADLGWLPGRFADTRFLLGLLNGLGFHGLLFLTLAQFYFHVDRSITLRYLTEFGKAPRRFLTLEIVRQGYGVEGIVQSRLEAMVVNRFLICRETRYYLTWKGRVAAWMGGLTRKLFRIQSM